MKVSKIKTLLYLLGVMVIFAGVTVDAASLSITKSSSSTDNQAIFEIYLDASDGEISNQTLKIQSSSTSIKPSIRVADNVNDVICNSDGVCAMQGTYSSKIKIAEVTLKNTTSNDITDVTISAAIEGIGNITSEAVTLKTEVTTTTKIKSKNAELSNLTTSVGTMDPAFTKEGRSYTIKGIKDTVNSITFSATCENCTTTYTCLENCSISENKNNRIMLEDGANSIELTTTSEDGSNQATYNFIVYRGEVEEPSAYIKDLKIDGVDLDTKFDMLLNDYTATIDLSVEKLDIKYELEDPEAKVKITGNEKLVEGENIITITVTSSDEKSKQVYTITVNKEEICDPETEDCEEEAKDVVVVEKKNPTKIWLIVIISLVALAIIGISGFLIFKKKKNNKNKNDKNNKPNSKIKKAFIEEETNNSEESNELQEEIIEPKIKPSVDEALEDLMKTKEIELNNL